MADFPALPPMPDSSLPNEIIQSIAIANAKSIGEQPAILANLALANQILNNNLQQQMFISNQQAMNQIVMATTAKCVSLITSFDDDGADPSKTADAVKQLIEALKQFQTSLKPQVPPPTGG